MPKTRLVRRLAVLALLCVAACANAQRPALVSDIDAAIRTPYMETATMNCVFQTCGISFSAVPAGRRREIDFVSCGLFNAAANQIYSVELDSLKINLLDASPHIFIAAVAYPGFAGRFSATSPTLAFFGAGTRPFVSAMAVNPVEEFTCTVSGREVAI